MTLPRIAIFGAGSVGCFVGGAWALAGFDVTLYGRETFRDEIAANGLTLTDHTGWKAHLAADSVAYETSFETLGSADLVAVCVKSTDTKAAAVEIARHARKDAVVLSLQNGISNVGYLRDKLPDHKVLAGMVGFNVAWAGGGEWHKGTSGDLVAEPHELLRPIVEKTRHGPARLNLEADMVSVAWGKLLVNLNNPINALSGKPLLSELSDRNYRRIWAATIREALRVLRVAGVRPTRVGPLPAAQLAAFLTLPDVVFNKVGLRLQKIDARARSSMADDFANERPTEIEFLNGEIVNLAHAYGLGAPVNERIVQLVRAAERGGRKSWSGEDLVQATMA